METMSLGIAKPMPSLPPLRQNERVQANDSAVNINERAATVAAIDRSVRLDIDRAAIRIGLTSDCADHSHRHGVSAGLSWAPGRQKPPGLA